ncbi:MAG TPA: hypothetical protein VG432_05220 [Gemmatimonadaceae bacterium]|nr:hypothetical protein [Gemmatimonadaceae bacterium]
MVLVAVAFVIGGILGAVLTAALVARGQRALALAPPDVEMPVRPADHWAGDSGPTDLPYTPDERIERFEKELARRLGREAASTVRERRAALTRALRPASGITIRVRD